MPAAKKAACTYFVAPERGVGVRPLARPLPGSRRRRQASRPRSLRRPRSRAGARRPRAEACFEQLRRSPCVSASVSSSSSCCRRLSPSVSPWRPSEAGTLPGLGAWQGRRDSNSRPADLESAALPTELRPCTCCGSDPRLYARYFVSMCIVCSLQVLQNFLSRAVSSRRGVPSSSCSCGRRRPSRLRAMGVAAPSSSATSALAPIRHSYSRISVTTPAPTVLAALADGEAHLLLERDGRDQLDLHRDVVARHHHLHALGQLAPNPSHPSSGCRTADGSS